MNTKTYKYFDPVIPYILTKEIYMKTTKVRNELIGLLYQDRDRASETKSSKLRP